MKLRDVIIELFDVMMKEGGGIEVDIIVLHTNTSMSVTGKSPEGILWIGGQTDYIPPFDAGQNDPEYKEDVAQEQADYEGMSIDEWKQLNWSF